MNITIKDNVLFAVLSDGTSVRADISDDQIAYLMQNFSNTELLEQWVRDNFLRIHTAKFKKAGAIKEGLSSLNKTSDFYYEGSSLYMKGISLSIPELLAKELATAYEQDKNRFTALVNFWKLCSINPNAQARQDLFKFLQGGKFTITPKGLLVSYRNVNVKHDGINRKLHEFVTGAVVKVKAWKKGTSRFEVYQNDNSEDIHYGEYDIFDMKKRSTTPDGKYIGNLAELAKPESDTVYTDAHTGEFEIKIGTPVTMSREKCDPDASRGCSYGLHQGNRSFLRQGSFGQVGLVCLVNPYNVVSVPEYDSNKFRCCEYLPIGTVDYDEYGSLIEIDTDLYEDDYCQFTTDQINEMLVNADMKEYQINSLFDLASNENIREVANEKIKDRNVFMDDEGDLEIDEEGYEYEEDDDYYYEN